MSTKVYQAWSVRTDILLDRMIDITKKARHRAYKEISKQLLMKNCNSLEEKNPFRMAMFLWSEYKAQSIKGGRNAFDFTLHLNIRFLDEYAYIIPYGDMLLKNVWGFLDHERGFDDFCYWNNTDPLEDVDEDEWEMRGKVWGQFDDEGWENNSLRLVVIEPDFGSLFGLEKYYEPEYKRLKKRLV